MNEYTVTLMLSICDTNYEEMVAENAELETEVYRGAVTITMPFLPFVGMHIGRSQLLSVTQVHWLGQDEFEVSLRSVDCASFSYSLYHEKRRNPEQRIGSPIDRHFANIDVAIARVAGDTTGIFPAGSKWVWAKELEEEGDEE